MAEEKGPQRRGPWAQHEDKILLSLVTNVDALNWVRISSSVGSRTPKQCRDRYHQKLKSSLNHERINAEEGAQIEKLVAEFGKKWVKIARRLPGRSDNAVKNWWKGSQNRRRRAEGRTTHTGGGENYRPQPRPMREASQTVSLPHCTQSPMEYYRPQGPWPEAHLPSPPASESPNVEGYHHTTSTARTTVLPRRRIELPPLRTLPHGLLGHHYSSSGPSGSIPSLNYFTQHSGNDDARGQQHLLTAPNSPHINQQASDKGMSRMSISALLR